MDNEKKPNIEDIQNFLGIYSRFRRSRRTYFAREFYRESTNQERRYFARNYSRVRPSGEIKEKAIIESLAIGSQENSDWLEVCPFQLESEKADAYADCVRTAKTLLDEPPFIKWAKNSELMSRIDLLSQKKKCRYHMLAGEGLLPDLIPFDIQMLLRYQSIIAGALLVYYDKEFLKMIWVNDNYHKQKPSSQTNPFPQEVISAAKKLKRNLLKIGFMENNGLISRLDRDIIEPFTQDNRFSYRRAYTEIFYPQIPETTLRKYFIREICLLGNEEFFLYKSAKGRFFNDFTTLACELINYQADQRTVANIQKEFDRAHYKPPSREVASHFQPLTNIYMPRFRQQSDKPLHN